MADQSILIEKYTKKIQEDPSSRVFAPLGEIYRKIGMQQEAIRVLTNGLRHNPSYILGQIALAQCYYDLEEYQQSYNLLHPYVQHHSDNVKLITLYARLCEKLSYMDEALANYKKILFYSPKNIEAIEYITKNEDDIIERKYQEKVATFNVDELEDDISRWAQVDLVDRDKSEHTENEVLVNEEETIDTAPYFSHTLVDLYLKQGARDRAMELLEKAVEINPQDTPAKERLDKLRSEEKSTYGHDDLMKIFDSKIEKINKNSENKIEHLKMAFDLFMVHINKKRDMVMTQ